MQLRKEEEDLVEDQGVRGRRRLVVCACVRGRIYGRDCLALKMAKAGILQRGKVQFCVNIIEVLPKSAELIVSSFLYVYP